MTREEAIEIVKKHGISADGTKFESALRDLIPELAESEDERIRKRLIEYFEGFRMGNANVKWEGLTVQDVLAWLEKQKEQKPSIFPPGLGEVRWNPIPSAKKGLMEKPAEPSGKPSRQEYLYHLLANHIITFTDYTYLLAKKPFDYECANIPQKDYTPVEQKPAEWSEEDEKDMAHIIRILDDCYVYGTHDLSKTDRENLVNKLKSLRPQYHGDVTMTEAYKMGLEAGKASHWKPSEEQMDALHRCVDYLHGEGSGYFDPINSLYEQLKKL